MVSPTGFIDNTAAVARAAETGISIEQFYNGVNPGGSNAVGIGINPGGGAINNTPDKWTLLDQRGNPRTPQESQALGGTGLAVGAEGSSGFPIQVATNGAIGERPTSDGDAELPDVPTGWVAASGFQSSMTVGQNGNNFGYDDGGYGTLVPDEFNGVVVDAIFGVSTTGLITVTTVGNAPIYGNSNILLSVDGAPANPYLIVGLAPGLGFYQSTHADLATYLSNNLAASLGVTIAEA